MKKYQTYMDRYFYTFIYTMSFRNWESALISLRPKGTIINLPKNIISAYIQFKTGKGLLQSFQHTIHKAPDTKHLLLECEEYRMERAAMKKLLKNIPLGLNVLFCMYIHTSKGHEALAWFLQKTNICTVRWQNEKRGYIIIIIIMLSRLLFACGASTQFDKKRV